MLGIPILLLNNHEYYQSSTSLQLIIICLSVCVIVQDNFFKYV